SYQRLYTFCLTHPPTTDIYTLSLHDALPIFYQALHKTHGNNLILGMEMFEMDVQPILDEYFSDLINQRSFESESRIWNNYTEDRSEEHTSELQSRENLVCRLLLEKKKKHQDK